LRQSRVSQGIGSAAASPGQTPASHHDLRFNNFVRWRAGKFVRTIFDRVPAGVLCAVTALTFLSVAPAAADKRVALVIGNGAYQNALHLPNPRNDAQDVADALQRSGFETILGLDLDKTKMDAALIRFARAARDADVAMFYYSGHAMQYAGINYLAPIDAKLTDEADLRQLERVDDIVADLQRAKNLRILVLDSCRDNPLAEDLKRSIGTTRGMSIQRGLAKIENPEGLIVAYATQAGRVAEDGSGRHSPFTTAFLKYIETPEEIGTVFRRISADVYAQTKQTQLPELSLSLIGEFYLHGQPDVRAGAQASAGPALSWSEAAQAWAATKDTTSQAVLEDFVRQFGNTVYGNMAQARLREMKSAALDTQPRQRSEPSAAARPVDLPDPRRRDLVTDCDRLAAFPWDPDRSPGVTGVVFEKIDVVPALAACNDAMRQYPDVARFYYQAGRVALKQKDDVLARQYYEKAVSMGSEAALVGIGTIYRDAKDYAEARRWFEKAAAAGVPVAMNNLGNIYGTGLGVAQDYAEAGRWYEKAAVAGEPEAMTNLGELYRTGMGVAKDYAEARRWYEKAAAAGEPTAMWNLGEFYRTGMGAAKDYTEARQWYEKAAAAGEPKAMWNLGDFYRNGTGVPKNLATARQWFEKAAAAGLPLGMTTVGFLYGTGAGVAQDYGEARRWWEKAAAMGERGAMWNLGEVYRNGYGVPRNLATARQWYEKGAAAGDDQSKEILKTWAKTPNRHAR
jgi:uncharacterized protein